MWRVAVCVAVFVAVFVLLEPVSATSSGLLPKQSLRRGGFIPKHSKVRSFVAWLTNFHGHSSHQSHKGHSPYYSAYDYNHHHGYSPSYGHHQHPIKKLKHSLLEHVHSAFDKHKHHALHVVDSSLRHKEHAIHESLRHKEHAIHEPHHTHSYSPPHYGEPDYSYSPSHHSGYSSFSHGSPSPYRNDHKSTNYGHSSHHGKDHKEYAHHGKEHKEYAHSKGPNKYEIHNYFIAKDSPFRGKYGHSKMDTEGKFADYQSPREEKYEPNSGNSIGYESKEALHSQKLVHQAGPYVSAPSEGLLPYHPGSTTLVPHKVIHQGGHSHPTYKPVAGYGQSPVVIHQYHAAPPPAVTQYSAAPAVPHHPLTVPPVTFVSVPAAHFHNPAPVHHHPVQHVQHQIVHPVPVHQPIAPVYQPITPVYQPIAPVHQPIAPVHQPITPIYRPTAPEHHHIAPIYRPATPEHHHTAPVHHHIAPEHHHTAPVPQEYHTPLHQQLLHRPQRKRKRRRPWPLLTNEGKSPLQLMREQRELEGFLEMVRDKRFRD